MRLRSQGSRKRVGIEIRINLNFTAPATKKTSNRIVKFGKNKEFTKILPSEKYEQWHDLCMLHRGRILSGLRNVPLPLKCRVQVKASVYLAGDYGDLLGYEQAIADVLQAEKWSKAKNGKPSKMLRTGLGIIVDDVLIESWDGSRRYFPDPKPRVELIITTMEEAVQERLELIPAVVEKEVF